MATVNQYFQTGNTIGRYSEQSLYEDLIIESMKIYGWEVYYLPRRPSNYDSILTEDTTSYFDEAYPIEMYMENVQGFEGDGELMTKFGLEIRDTANFIVARRRWKAIVGDDGKSVLPNRPAEGDVIYFPKTHALFEIRKVDSHTPFYQVGKLYTWKLQCEVMQLSNERFNTGISEIDDMVAGMSLSVDAFEVLTETGDSLLMETNSLTPLTQETYGANSEMVLYDNDKFTAEVNLVLDFSEKNPFGEV